MCEDPRSQKVMCLSRVPVAISLRCTTSTTSTTESFILWLWKIWEGYYSWRSHMNILFEASVDNQMLKFSRNHMFDWNLWQCTEVGMILDSLNPSALSKKHRYWLFTVTPIRCCLSDHAKPIMITSSSSFRIVWLGLLTLTYYYTWQFKSYMLSLVPKASKVMILFISDENYTAWTPPLLCLTQSVMIEWARILTVVG